LTFWSEDIVNASVEALDRCPPEKLEPAVSFVSQLGTLCIAKVLDLFAQDEYPSRKKALFDLLTAIGGPVLVEACARVQGAPVNVIRNLLLLMQRIGGQDTVPQIRALMTHESVLVRMDAMVTLL